MKRSLDDMADWVDTLVQLRDAGEAAVIVTIASARGSVPRTPGTKMIVTATAVHGTIGGGHLEHQAISIARDQLRAGAEAGALRRFPLGASLGQCCGGMVNLLFEPLARDSAWIDALADARRQRREAILVTAISEGANGDKIVVTADGATCATDAAGRRASLIGIAREMLVGRDMPDARDGARLVTVDGSTYLFERSRANDFAIVLFGAGHVGRAIVRAVAELPCRVTWVDAREDEFPSDIPANVTVECTDAPEEIVDAAPPAAYFLVMTHSHPLDEMLTERILRRGDYAYFGLIGSQTKRRAFEKRLERRGVPVERFATMTCPIGIAGIPGKEPAVIALAVAAQLLQVHALRAQPNASCAKPLPASQREEADGAAA